MSEGNSNSGSGAAPRSGRTRSRRVYQYEVERSDRQMQQIQVVLDIFEAWGRRDFQAIAGHLSERHLDRTYFGHLPINPNAVIRMMRGFLDSFPDWSGTIDEIIPTDEDHLVVRYTGRGTQRKPFLGRDARGQQLAAPMIDILTFDEDNRIIEYRGNFPFTSVFDEISVTAAEDVMERRAEQGGTFTRWSPPRGEGEEEPSSRVGLVRALRDGRLSVTDFLRRKTEGPTIRRCEALLETNLRRCGLEAVEGSIYCSVHQDSGFGPPEPPQG